MICYATYSNVSFTCLAWFGYIYVLYYQHWSVNALRPSDNIWRQIFGPTLIQVMASLLIGSSTFSQNPWWCHRMKIFSALLAICVGNSSVTGEFPAQRPVTRSFDVFFDLRMNKRLSKPSWGWWFETPSRPLWRHCDAVLAYWQLNP